MLAITMTLILYGQNQFQATILDEDTKEPLIGAHILFSTLERGSITSVEGVVTIDDLPSGSLTGEIFYVGYEDTKFTVTLPQQSPLTIYLEHSEEELEEVVITTTRSSRLIQDIPTRLEAITAEELGEKAFMNSANISILLRESTGIQMQQTSANSANQSIRIQGLDGRYTQLLKDGFPLFGGFSSGLSIMQIPPLDLKQVDIIKGSASTLYGGGAIAGLVNLITKKPEEEPQLDFMLTQTQAVGTTLNNFYAQQFGKVGVSLYTSGHLQKAYDVNKDDFSDIPKIKSLSINPAFYYDFDKNTKLRIALNSAFENRLGGDITAIQDQPNSEHTFTEENNSNRMATQVSFTKQFSENANLTIKNSVSFFDRTITVPNFNFEGKQTASFSEASYHTKYKEADLVFGANIWTDQFAETPNNQNLLRDYSNNTYGLFAQSTFPISDKIAIEGGLRMDYNTDYDWFVLPRVNLLFSFSKQWASRIGGGLGYKLPTIFTEEAETRSYRNILPITINSTNAETSIGVNWDVNYKTILFDRISFSINNLLFYTQLNDPLVLMPSNANLFTFENATGKASSRGIETNIKMGYEDFKLFLQYALIDARLDYNGINQQKPLTPKHNAGAVLMYENEKWRIGYEIYYTGEQILSNTATVSDYWMMGLLVARQVGMFNVFVNFENFTDTRQSNFQDVVLPPHTSPSFTELWSPTDGFIFTAGVRINVFGTHDHH